LWLSIPATCPLGALKNRRAPLHRIAPESFLIGEWQMVRS
jgi:hypothetical protein